VGQAKARGSYDVRKAQGIERLAEEARQREEHQRQLQLAEAARRAALPPKRREAEARRRHSSRLLMATVAGVALSMGTISR